MDEQAKPRPETAQDYTVPVLDLQGALERLTGRLQAQEQQQRPVPVPTRDDALRASRHAASAAIRAVLSRIRKTAAELDVEPGEVEPDFLWWEGVVAGIEAAGDRGVLARLERDIGAVERARAEVGGEDAPDV